MRTTVLFLLALLVTVTMTTNAVAQGRADAVCPDDGRTHHFIADVKRALRDGGGRFIDLPEGYHLVTYAFGYGSADEDAARYELCVTIERFKDGDQPHQPTLVVMGRKNEIRVLIRERPPLKTAEKGKKRSS